MFYPHTIKGKVNIRPDLISPPIPTVYYNTFLFDGVDDYVNAGNDASLQASATGIFVSTWIYLDGTGDSIQKIFEKQPATGDREYLLYKSSTGKLDFQVGSGASLVTVQGSTTLPTGQFLHLAGRCTGAGGVVEVYINGVLDATIAAPVGAINVGTNDLLIGKAVTATQRLKGSMSLPIIFNDGLSGTAANTLYNAGKPKLFSGIPTILTDESVMAYAMSSSDSSLSDLSINSNTGAANGGVTDNGELLEFDLT